MFRTARIATAIAVAIAAAALALPSAASADTMALSAQPPCAESHDASAPAFNVRLCGVSDIDQYRTGLPGNGNVICGPSSLFNVLNGMYNRQGIPVVAGGISMAFIDQTNPAAFSAGTTFLDTLGGWAGGSDGFTGWGDNRNAFKQAMAYADANGWNVATGMVDTMTTAEFGLAIAQRLDKAPVQLGYGTYSMGDEGYLERTGGHFMTVVSAKGATQTGEVELLLHDPARAADHNVGTYLETQSAYRTEKVTLKKVAFNVKVDGIVQIRYRWQLTGDTYVGGTRMVEGFNWFSATKG